MSDIIRKVHVDPADRRYTFSLTQDVEPYLKQNHHLRSVPQKSDWGRHVASIPLVILTQWLNEAWAAGNTQLNFNSPEFLALIKKKINDPEWKALRTRQMSLNTYATFQAAIADQLARSDLTSQIIDCITLFEAEASYELFRTRGTETLTILVPTNPAAVTVTNAANNGSGAIRLTATAHGLTTGQLAIVSAIVGTAEANAEWVVTVIDPNTVDLNGSTFVNAYTSGGTIQALQGQVSLPSDYLSWRRVTWTGSPRGNLDYLDPSTFNSFTTSLPFTGIPKFFTIEGSTFKIMPTGTGTFEFDYYAKTPALSSSLNWLFTNRVDVYWSGVLEQAYLYLKDWEQAGSWRQLKEQKYGSVRAQRFKEGTG